LKILHSHVFNVEYSPNSVLQDWNAARFFFQDMKDELLNKFAVDGNSPPDEAAIKSILSSEPRHVSAELRFQKVQIYGGRR